MCAGSPARCTFEARQACLPGPRLNATTLRSQTCVDVVAEQHFFRCVFRLSSVLYFDRLWRIDCLDSPRHVAVISKIRRCSSSCTFHLAGRSQHMQSQDRQMFCVVKAVVCRHCVIVSSVATWRRNNLNQVWISRLRSLDWSRCTTGLAWSGLGLSPCILQCRHQLVTEARRAASSP